MTKAFKSKFEFIGHYLVPSQWRFITFLALLFSYTSSIAHASTTAVPCDLFFSNLTSTSSLNKNAEKSEKRFRLRPTSEFTAHQHTLLRSLRTVLNKHTIPSASFEYTFKSNYLLIRTIYNLIENTPLEYSDSNSTPRINENGKIFIPRGKLSSEQQALAILHLSIKRALIMHGLEAEDALEVALQMEKQAAELLDIKWSDHIQCDYCTNKNSDESNKVQINPFSYQLRQLSNLRFLDIQQKVYKMSTIDREFEIGFIAGYSIDASKIYLDRRIPRYWKTSKGQFVFIDPFLVFHEFFEKALIDFTPLTEKYIFTHQLAERAEQRLLEIQNISRREYADLMANIYEKTIFSSGALNPPDLDMTPYFSFQNPEEDQRVIDLVKRIQFHSTHKD